MIFEIDRTQQWPVLNSNWILNPDLRDINPFFAKYIYPMGYMGNHKDKINPWRSVATRQMHFAYVMARTDCDALDLEWSEATGSVDLHERSHQYWKAFLNCDWGT